MIDGDISDAVWKRAALAETFIDYQTSKPVADQTEARLLYDKDYLYIAFYCHDSQPESIVARETVRDAELENDDSVGISLDTFTTHNWQDFSRFTVNPLGTRQAHLGGGRAGKVEWQGDWDAAAKRVKDGWTTEMRIPWAILSYPRGKRQITMGINFQRQQQRTKINSQWSDLTPQFYNEREGQWIGVEPPVQTWKPRLSFLPYLLPTGQASGGHSQLHSGLDIRYQPTPELISVATINPDFQSVEGAIESIAFTRGQRFVPDNRPFFQEGRNYLNLGRFYQIGSYFDSTNIGQFDTGMKLYGKMTPDTTVGALGTISLGNQANFVTQVRREFGPTSNGNVMLVQRLAPGGDNTVAAASYEKRWGNWSVDGQGAQTAGPGAGGMAYTGAISFSAKNLFTTVRYRRVGSTFQDSLGFVPFNDYHGWSSHTEWYGEWRHGFFRDFFSALDAQYEHHLNDLPFRRNLSLDFGFNTRSDYHLGFNISGGKFNYDTDFTYGFNIGGNVSNRFRQWNLSFLTGQQANLPYTAFGPGFSLRLFKKFDISVNAFLQNYQGISQQHVVTFNYELSPYRSWGGRLVIENANTNVFLSYHNSGRGGMDTYIILGDPNATRIVKRVMVKFVFAL